MMIMATQTLSLLQDWTARRDWLSSPTCELPADTRPVLAAIFDRLITAHGANPATAQASRFPFRIDGRAFRRELVIHDHMEGNALPVVQTEQDSRDRIGGILARLKKLDLQGSAKVPESRIMGTPQPEPGDVAPMVAVPRPSPVIAPQPPAIWLEIESALRHPWHSRWMVYQKIESSLNVRKGLPENAMSFLRGRASSTAIDACVAAEFLLKVADEPVLKHVLGAWKDRLRAQGNDYISQRLRSCLLIPGLRSDTLALVRREMGGDHAAFRLHVLQLLSETGTVDDISLMLDLLRVPASNDEHPQERTAMLNVIRVLADAGRFPEPPVLTQPGNSPPPAAN
jgi:hypothetical protein